MKRVALELGGKSPNLIFSDANIDSGFTHLEGCIKRR